MNNIIQISYKYYNEALKLIKSNNISQAKIKLEKSIKLYGADVQVLNLLASCEYLFCNFNKANLYWSKSLKINNNQNKVRDYVEELNSEKFKKLLEKYNKAIKCIHNEDYNNSINLLNEVIDIDSNLIEPYYIIGLCLINNGKIDKGLDYLKIASKKDNGNL